MCIFCFSSEPLTDEEKKGRYGEKLGPYMAYGGKYDISLCQAPCSEPCCWCGSAICWVPSIMCVRHKALNHLEPGSGWKNYECCQGMFKCGPCQAGACGEKSCPCPCACIEACCCPGLAASATSIMIRRKYQLGLDEDDIRLIRFSNCLQCASIICICLSICIPAFERSAKALDALADCVFCCVQAGITTQTYHEINLRESGGGAAPVANEMER